MPAFPVLIATMVAAAFLAAAGASLGAGWLSGVIAGAAFLVSPLLWSDSVPPSALYPLPFVAAWLFASGMLVQRRDLVWAIAAGAALGAGVYASTPSAVMMPAYAALTVAVLAPSRILSVRHWSVFLAAVLVTSAPLFLRWMMQPSLYRELVLSHHLYDANRFNVLQGVREVSSWVGLTARSEVFWDYLNPAFLFVTGRVLSWPLLVLVPVGMYAIVARDVSIVGRLVCAAFLIAPLAASLPADPPMRTRIAWILPAAALLSAYGVEFIRGARRGKTP